MTNVSAIAWTPSTTSSRRDTSSWMSSRSNGVTKASSSFRVTSRSISSPRFSSAWMVATRSSSRSYVETMSLSAAVAAWRLSPSATNSSKNLGSLGSRRKLIAFSPGSLGRRFADVSWQADRVECHPGERRERPGSGECQDPGDEDPARDAPADVAETLARADAHDGARDDLGRRDRHPQLGRPEQDGRGRRLGRETVDWFELGHPLAH